MNVKAISIAAITVSGIALGFAGYTFKKEKELSRHFDELLAVLLSDDIVKEDDDEVEDLDKELDPTLEEYVKQEEEIINDDAEKAVESEPEEEAPSSEPTGGIDVNDAAE